MYAIGIDLGGTGIKAGVVDEKGNIIAKVKCPTNVERGYEAVIRDMADLCKKAAEAANVSMDEIQSVGIGIPGLINPKTGIVPICVNLGWKNVPMIEEMHKYIDKPIFVDNDATVAGLAEAIAGVSAGAKNSVFVTLGTGVGGGVIINGKPFSGSHGVASEIGHMIVVSGGEKCSCGNCGCWERYASASAIIREGRKFAAAHPNCAIAKAVDGDLSRIEARTIFDLAKEGDKDSLVLFHNYVDMLCVGLVNLINLYDPEIFALGGGVSNAGTFLLDAVRERMEDLVFAKELPHARVELAQLGNDAGIIGAAMLGK